MKWAEEYFASRRDRFGKDMNDDEKGWRDLCGYKIEKDQFPALWKTHSGMADESYEIDFNWATKYAEKRAERTNYGDKNPFKWKDILVHV